MNDEQLIELIEVAYALDSVLAVRDPAIRRQLKPLQLQKEECQGVIHPNQLNLSTRKIAVVAVCVR